MVRLDAVMPLHRLVARYFRHPRIREAFSFHSLFIGGDPFRVPAIYAALVYLQVLDGGWYADGGVYSLVEAMARPLDVRCGARVEAVETAGGRVRGVRLVGGERLQADVVVSNADVMRTDALLGRPPVGRPLRPTMSCFLLYLGLDRKLDALLHHTLLVGRDYRDFIRTVTRGRQLPRTFSTYVHAPARTEPGMATPGGDSLAVLLPVPNLRADVNWEREGDALRDALVADLENTFGLDGLASAVRVEHRMTPLDFARDLGAVDGNAFAVEPTLRQSAYFRPPNRVRGVTGMYHVGGGTHPGAGIPGVLLGAGVTAALVLEDARRAACGRRHELRGAHRPRRRATRRGPAASGAGRGPRDHAPRRSHVRARLPAAAARRPRRRLPALPRVPHARRPRRRGARGGRRPRGGRRGVGGGPLPASGPARSMCSTRSASATHCRARRVADFCAGMRQDLGARDVRHRGGRRPLLLSRRRDGRRS